MKWTCLLAVCTWRIWVTSIWTAHLSIEEAIVLQRERWQIELFYKLWKQYG
jgi:hypothetical protein